MLWAEPGKKFPGSIPIKLAWELEFESPEAMHLWAGPGGPSTIPVLNR